MKTENEILLEKQLAEARETNAKFHRRLQKLEGMTLNEYSYQYGVRVGKSCVDRLIKDAVEAEQRKLEAYKTATRKLVKDAPEVAHQLLVARSTNAEFHRRVQAAETRYNRLLAQKDSRHQAYVARTEKLLLRLGAVQAPKGTT